MTTPIDPNTDSDTLDLEMDALPLPTWARNAIDALDNATSTAQIAKIIEPIRAQPEGAAKDAVRAAKSAAVLRVEPTKTLVKAALTVAPVAAPVTVTIPVAAPTSAPIAARWVPDGQGGFNAITTGPAVVGSVLRAVTKGGKVSYQVVVSVLSTRANGERVCAVTPQADYVAPTSPVTAPVEIAAESAQEPTYTEGSLESAIMGIATEGAKNAAGTTLGSMATGELRGVHAPVGVNAIDMTTAQRRALWRTSPTATAKTATKAPLLKTGDLIMGSIAAGQGAACSWSRARHAVNIASSELYAALAGIGRSDIAPKLKSTKSQFGDVMGSLNHNGLTARAATKAEATKQGSMWASHIVSRWIVGSVDFRAELGSLGDKELVAELTESGEIQFSGNQILAERVRTAFTARVTANVYDSTDLIQWFERVLRKTHHGVTWGGMVYIPAGEVEIVKELIAAVKGLMGRSFAVACVTTEEGLIAGLADGLLDEVVAISDKFDLAQSQAAARDAKKAACAGADAAAQGVAASRAVVLSGAASTLLRECGDVAERIAGYTTMLGEPATKAARERLAALRTKLEPLVDDSSARFAALDLT